MKKIIKNIFICLFLFNILSFNVFSIKNKLTGEEIVKIALKYEGYPYIYGGASSKGFDCSGFVYFIYNSNGYTIGRTSDSQYYDGEHIDFEDLDVGDILIFANTYKCGISHSGIYIGDNKFIHAANSRKGVIITDFSDSYYKNRFVTGVRVVDKLYKDNIKNNKIILKIDIKKIYYKNKLIEEYLK